MLPALWIIGLSALFHTSMGNMFQTDRRMHSLRRTIMHVISVAVSKTLGHFSISRRKTHYASHIYILFNICQTFINYKLMKCSTVLGDQANEDIDFCFWHIFVRFNTILFLSRSINYYYTYVRPPLTRYDTGITCWRWAHHGIPMAFIYNDTSVL